VGALACAGVLHVSAASGETVVYAFKGGSDGFNPTASLTRVDGLLYGTTVQGGGTGCSNPGCGTVFSLTPGGTEHVVYTFKGGSDGAWPHTNLVNINGTLYGATSQGGIAGCNNGCGTVFSITPKGIEKVLYAFNGGSDGAGPGANLIGVNGVLYGTTEKGGGMGCAAIGGCGTVFSINPATGAEKVLYSFGGASGDGIGLSASLIDVADTLYGTTAWGGAADCDIANLPPGCGTVFSFNPTTGTEKVAYSFGGQLRDGAFPQASLIEVGGKLYGTTYYGGGGTGCEGEGCGTVFALDPETGTEQVLYRFKDGSSSDGAEPAAGLISVGGLLYGTASGGPARPSSVSNCGASHCGMVFSIKP
jgi:uncharacterized repeat protein (TIGR03803 family)